MRSVCRQHSYIKVPGMTRSSTKWQTMNQSSGWISASARISAHTEPASARIEGLDSMYQGHPAAGQGERVGQVKPSNGGPNAGGQVTSAEGLDLTFIKRLARATGTRSVQSGGLTPARCLESRGRGTMPLPAASSAAEKNPAQPSRMVRAVHRRRSRRTQSGRGAYRPGGRNRVILMS